MIFRKPPVITDPVRVDELLSRGVEAVYPSTDWLRAELLSGRRLRLYTGWDPTSADVHIGHTAWMWKLRAFQELGHEVIVLLGTFTAMIGDPTGKADARKPLTRKQVSDHAKRVGDKFRKIFTVPGNPISVRMNHTWLGVLTFEDVVALSSHFTVQQMLERDMFDLRMKEGRPIHLHEFLYPLMQGFDSVALDVDLEVGGNDQTFNMLAGRTLLKQMKGKEKGVMTLALITDASGRKLGKSEGNAINIDLEPGDLYGKVMTLSDDVIWQTFVQCTPLPLERIASLRAELESDPRRAKAKLAWELVALYHTSAAADVAEQEFVRVFAQKEIPDVMPAFDVRTPMGLIDVLVETKMCASKGDARRQIEQGGVRLNGRVVHDVQARAEAGVLQKGKRHFVRLIVR